MSELPFTMDVEDPDKYSDGSFQNAVAIVLEWLSSEGGRGSFFIVGELAQAHPGLVQRIAKEGHEIGLHGLRHVAVTDLSEQQFRQDTAEGKAILEDITGSAVVGYRAPMFSITSATPWAPEALMDLGFNYSSSVLPARNPRYSMADAPRHPFQWPCGLVELPAPITSFMGITMPFLGGIYFRYFPTWIIRSALARLSSDQVPWFYCHPYDFRVTKRYIHMRDTPLWANALLMLNRRKALVKMKNLYGPVSATTTLAEIAKNYQVV
jgi:polysaccharide deacetylase family protein (PEP-CTERM system associated)